MHKKTDELTTNPNLNAHLLLFVTLIVINLFVGGMIGLERTLFPLVAKIDFRITSFVAIFSFIATFGVTKACFNFIAGNLADHWGRNKVLILGWLIASPVPLILMFAHSWSLILFANVLLGVSQALTWSMTVVMKIDIAGSGQRGLAIGLNEFAGYAGMALVAYITGIIASIYGLRPAPFYIGLVIVVIGIILSLLIQDTRNFAHRSKGQNKELETAITLFEIFRRGTWANSTLSSASVLGLATNLKDGMLWGMLPIYLISKGLSIRQISVVVALYPIVWSVSQLLFGPLSDRIGRKILIVPGMFIQGLSILGFAWFMSYSGYIISAIFAGLGTSMVYPTLLALVSDVSAIKWRASALGVYRFWRDIGYAVGAIGVGLLVDVLNSGYAMIIVSLLLCTTALIAFLRIKETPTG